MRDLEGRVAVVTGAGAGIGLGLAHALASAGANVAVADRDADRVAVAVATLRTRWDVGVLGVTTDVADAASVEALADAVYAQFGAVHVLCNNAGVSAVGYSWQALEDWRRVLSVNLMGTVHGLQSFVPRMLRGETAGHIVNISSMAGLIPVLLKAPYSASKHAIIGLSKTLREELNSIGAPIQVSVVCPGGVATRMVEEQIARYEGSTILPAAGRAVLGRLKATCESGISPEAAAELIVEAIRSGTFWVFPNAADFLPLVEREHAQLLRDGELATEEQAR
jgi:NAD(P)-dependent dehydrogenase (short-subunit alcohol dehydrogenase family)